MKTLSAVLRQLWLLGCLSIFSSCAARPPHEAGPFRPSELVELTHVVPGIRLDIRYATARNFMGRVLYPQARAFLQRPAAEALAQVQAELRPLGYGLLVFDGYRPWRITKQMWDHTPAAKKEFVADPRKGSRHNRGCAVDLTLCDLATGREIEMPGAYDEMSPRSYAELRGRHPSPARSPRPAPRPYGSARLRGAAGRVVALRFPGLEVVPDSGRAV